MLEFFGVVTPWVAGFAGLILSSYVAYTRNDKEISNRIVALETKEEEDDKRLERIETAVTKVDGKVDKVLNYLLERR